MKNRRIVLVIGGGRGIGEAVARRFATAGDRVAVADFDGESAKTLAAELGGTGHAVEVRDERSVMDLFNDVINQHGRLDVMVNSAAIFRFGTSLRDLSLAEWREVVDVNLTGTFLCMREAARRMEDHCGASIINFSSGSGARANPSTGSYGASKAGVSHLTRIAAIELAERGIRVNAISPGPTLTPMLTAAHDPSRQASIAKAIPLGRISEPEDIAGTAFFLASSEARFITGEVLNVDGGSSVAGRLVQ